METDQSPMSETDRKRTLFTEVERDLACVFFFLLSLVIKFIIAPRKRRERKEREISLPMTSLD